MKADEQRHPLQAHKEHTPLLHPAWALFLDEVRAAAAESRRRRQRNLEQDRDLLLAAVAEDEQQGEGQS